jgi:hypothetical protein
VRKTTKNLSQVSRCPGQYSNQATIEYESTALSLCIPAWYEQWLLYVPSALTYNSCYQHSNVTHVRVPPIFLCFLDCSLDVSVHPKDPATGHLSTQVFLASLYLQRNAEIIPQVPSCYYVFLIQTFLFKLIKIRSLCCQSHSHVNILTNKQKWFPLSRF